MQVVPPGLGHGRRGAIGGEQRGDAEVEQLGLASGGDQDVAGLDVAVDDQALMRDTRARGTPFVRRARGDRLAPARTRVDRLAVDQLHHQVGHAVVGAAGIEQLGDARMIEAGEHAPLEAEPLDDRGRAVRGQDLDRGPLVELVVVALRFEDDPHAAAADSFPHPFAARPPAQPRRRPVLVSPAAVEGSNPGSLS